MTSYKCKVCGGAIYSAYDPYCCTGCAKRDLNDKIAELSAELEVEKCKVETLLKLVAIGDECPPGKCQHPYATDDDCAECWRKHINKGDE